MVWLTIALGFVLVTYVLMVVAAVVFLPDDPDGPEDD
jgi:hypothetical protein